MQACVTWSNRDGICGLCGLALLRAASLVRVKVKFTVRLAVCCCRRLVHTAILTVNLTLTRTSRAALTPFCPSVVCCILIMMSTRVAEDFLARMVHTANHTPSSPLSQLGANRANRLHTA